MVASAAADVAVVVAVDVVASSAAGGVVVLLLMVATSLMLLMSSPPPRHLVPYEYAQTTRPLCVCSYNSSPKSSIDLTQPYLTRLSGASFSVP